MKVRSLVAVIILLGMNVAVLFGNLTTVLAIEQLAKPAGQVENDFPAVTPEDPLGFAANFHLFARGDVYVGAHVDGNIAASSVSGNANFGTTKIFEGTQDIYYIQEIREINASSMPDNNFSKFIVGSDVTIEARDNGNKRALNGFEMANMTFKDSLYQDQVGSQYLDFDREFERLERTAATFMDQSAHYTVTGPVIAEGDTKKIDVTTIEEPIVVIDLPAEHLAAPIGWDIIDTKPEKSTIIVNVTGEREDVTINSPIDYNTRGNKAAGSDQDNNIIWNFGNRNGQVELNNTFVGTVLAPQAEVLINGSNYDGTMVADEIKVKGGETHRWDPNPIPPLTKSEKIAIPVQKNWIEADGDTSKRPAEITFTLFKHDAALVENQVAQQTIDQSSDPTNNETTWYYTFTELAKYENGVEIPYILVEGPVEYYEQPQISGDNSGFIVDNIYAPGTPDKPDPESPDPESPDPDNPDPESPDPDNPDPESPDPESPDPESPDPESPDPDNPDPESPNPESPDPDNPDPESPDPESPDPESPDPESPDPENPDPESPDPENPDPESPNPENSDPESPDPESPDPELPESEVPIKPTEPQADQSGPLELPEIKEQDTPVTSMESESLSALPKTAIDETNSDQNGYLNEAEALRALQDTDLTPADNQTTDDHNLIPTTDSNMEAKSESANGQLPKTGSTVQPWLMIKGGLLVAGVGFVKSRFNN